MPIEIERILAATDFSPAGSRAVQVAAEWARRQKAQLRIVHATPQDGWLSRAWGIQSSAAAAIQQHARSALKQLAESVDPARAIELSTGVLSGPASRSITSSARDFRADLVVVGARGEHDVDGQRTLGGTALKLLSSAESALLLVRRASEDPVSSVVAAVDLSPRSRAILEWADFAAAERPLHVCHVYGVPFAGRLEAYGLAESGIEMYVEQARSQHAGELGALVSSIKRTAATFHVIERGDPALELRRYIDSVRPSLVAIGKHGTAARSSPPSSVGNICRFIAGSVSADVLVV